jgi:ubiquinone/menaquinone biosynthesis C-methylase UbiE/DNA-binding transcriptional ArsR family regulator
MRPVTYPTLKTHIPPTRPAASVAVLDRLRALGDATRLRIVGILRGQELAVGEIAELLEQSQPRVSRHVRLLEEAGVAERRREGSWVFVRLTRTDASAALLAFLDAVGFDTAEQAQFDADRARVADIQARREAAAAHYFATHAEQWDAIRSLHVAEAEVEDAILAMMKNRRVGHLLDIGTGTGRMVEILGATAARITAIDRSPEMLRLARARLSGLAGPTGQATLLDLVQADFAALPLGDASVDSVVMHQVLHFASAPGQVIAEAARVLRGSGHLLIVDFAPHDREEFRREAAHARLGFSDAQIRGWFAASGLLLESSEALSGGALTVKLWLGRRRSDDQRNPSPHSTIRKVAA